MAVPAEYTLEVDVPKTGGRVRLGEGDPSASDVSQTYEEGTTVPVTAQPAVGYEFDHWEGNYPSGQRTNRSLSVTLRANSKLSPVFTKTKGEVTIVGYDPQKNENKFSNYTIQRNSEASFDFSSATLPHGVSWSDISLPPGDYNKRNISATGSYPWSAVGQLVDADGYCTATVIEDNHVITAGHCVYSEKTGWRPIFHDELTFVPGRNGGERPFQNAFDSEVKVKYIQTYKKWVDDRNQAYDIAVLTLNRNVSAETGSFAYKGRPADAPIYGEDWETTAPEDDTGLHTTGYPSDNASFVATGTAQWDMTVVGEGTENCDSTDGCHQIATGTKTNELLYSGHSGGPVWTADDSGRPTLVSVVSSSPNVAPKDWDIPKVELADPRAVRISTGKYSDVGRIVEKGNSVDLKPVAKLTVRPKPATVGEPVTLDASGSFVPDSSIESYKWDFDPSKGSGIDRITSTPKVTHTYTEESTVSPNVGVVSDEGQFATASTEVTIESASTPTPSLSELDVTIESISTCGTTCRRVSYRVENPTNTTIRDVQVAATITSGDQTVWTKQQTFDEISPGSNAFTSTVNLDAAAALVVQENDRQVTVTIEVTAGDETRTFTYERTV